MNRTAFFAILIVYSILLGATGYLSFYRFIGNEPFVSENDMKLVADDPELKKDLLIDAARARDRDFKLVDLATHSFDVLLGALIGFLSAMGASSGTVPTLADRGRQNQPPTPSRLSHPPRPTGRASKEDKTTPSFT
jgi:hypothetical protein